MFAAAPWVIDAAPYESTMGLVYKIYFFHMPSAWMFLLAAIVSGVASARFLFLKKASADGWALAAAELAVLFGLFTLVTGPLWARKAWGVWWVWDARLTSSLMLFMIFVAYLLLRRYGGPGSDKLGAGMALFGMANVPFIYVSVNVWRTLHPKTSVVPTLPDRDGWTVVVLRDRVSPAVHLVAVDAGEPGTPTGAARSPVPRRGSGLMRLLRVCVCCLAVGHYFSVPRASARLVVPYVLDAAQPKPSPDEFVPVTDVPESEQIPAIRLVATAYGFIWVVLLGYVWTVGKRLQTVESGARPAPAPPIDMELR